MNKYEPLWGKTELTARHDYVSSPEAPSQGSMLLKRKAERRRLLICLAKAFIPSLLIIILLELLLCLIQFDISVRKECHCFIGIIGGIVTARIQRHLYRGTSFPVFEYNSIFINFLQGVFVLTLGIVSLWVLKAENFFFWMVCGIITGYIIARDIYWWYASFYLYDEPPKWRRFP